MCYKDFDKWTQCRPWVLLMVLIGTFTNSHGHVVSVGKFDASFH